MEAGRRRGHGLRLPEGSRSGVDLMEETTTIRGCTICRGYVQFVGGICENCERHHRYGVLVLAALTMRESPVLGDMGLAAMWSTLDAIAFVMIDRHRLIRAHRRELNDEIREAQRDTRAAYNEGKAEGRSEGEWR